MFQILNPSKVLTGNTYILDEEEIEKIILGTSQLVATLDPFKGISYSTTYNRGLGSTFIKNNESGEMEINWTPSHCYIYINDDLTVRECSIEALNRMFVPLFKGILKGGLHSIMALGGATNWPVIGCNLGDGIERVLIPTQLLAEPFPGLIYTCNGEEYMLALIPKEDYETAEIPFTIRFVKVSDLMAEMPAPQAE